MYYLTDSNRSSNQDTTPYNKMQPIETTDKFITKEYFIYNKKDHIINAYTSDNRAPTDGGRFYYTLDTFGIIYLRSTTWPTCMRLQSNNDSLNNLFSSALGHILLKPKLHCNCDSITKIMFVPPVTKEE